MNCLRSDYVAVALYEVTSCRVCDTNPVGLDIALTSKVSVEQGYQTRFLSIEHFLNVAPLDLIKNLEKRAVSKQLE